jgi:hypothetical protein
MAKTDVISVRPLFQGQMAALGFTHCVRITHENLTTTAANTAQTIPLLSVKAGTVVDRAAMVLVTPFEDLSDAAFNTNTLTVGDGVDPDRFLHSNTAATGIEMNRNGTEVLYHINPVAASTAGLNTAPYMYTADDTVDAVIGSMALKALNDIDKGIVDIYLRVVPLIEQSPLVA